MKFKSLCLVVLALAFLLPSAYAQSVGISPARIDLGEVKKGSSVIGKFYIVTPNDADMLVSLRTLEGIPDVFNSAEYEGLIQNYSEEKCANWVEFPFNPVELKREQELKTAGGVIKGWREIKFILNVPQDAEPGYHVVRVNALPLVSAAPAGAVSINVRTSVIIPIIFKVPGMAVRSGSILDISSGDYSDGKLGINVYFKNDGTVTMSAQAESVEIYDRYDRLSGRLSSNLYYLKPGEMRAMMAWLDTEGLAVGDYTALGTVNYLSGNSSKQSVINIYEIPAAVKAAEEKYYFPWWVLLIPIIFAVAYIVYRWNR